MKVLSSQFIIIEKVKRRGGKEKKKISSIDHQAKKKDHLKSVKPILKFQVVFINHVKRGMKNVAYMFIFSVLCYGEKGL